MFDSSVEPESFWQTISPERLANLEAESAPRASMTADELATEQALFSVYDAARELAQTPIIFDADARVTDPLVALAASLAFAPGVS